MCALVGETLLHEICTVYALLWSFGGGGEYAGEKLDRVRHIAGKVSYAKLKKRWQQEQAGVRSLAALCTGNQGKKAPNVTVLR